MLYYLNNSVFWTQLSNNLTPPISYNLLTNPFNPVSYSIIPLNFILTSFIINSKVNTALLNGSNLVESVTWI